MTPVKYATNSAMSFCPVSLEVGEARALHEVAKPPADVEADDAEDDGRQQVEPEETAEAHPARYCGSGAYEGAYFGRYFMIGAN